MLARASLTAARAAPPTDPAPAARTRVDPNEPYLYCSSPGPAAYYPQGFANPARHPTPPAAAFRGRPKDYDAIPASRLHDKVAVGTYDVVNPAGSPAHAMRCRGRSSPSAAFGRGARVLLVGSTIAAGQQAIVFNDMRATPFRPWQ
jgi:hypothetical protein